VPKGLSMMNNARKPDISLTSRPARHSGHTAHPEPPQEKTGHQTAPVTGPLNPAPRRDVLSTLMASGIFRNTNADALSKLTEHVSPVRIPPGHVLIGQGDSGSRLYIVASGKVKMAYRRADGREVVLNVVGAADVFGEISCFDRDTREASATTPTEVWTVAIERDQLLGWMANRQESRSSVSSPAGAARGLDDDMS
jgi:Cyclic nucleotide-binding domain